MKNNIILDKSLQFSLDVIDMYKIITITKKEFIMSKQLLKSATSVGANINEAISAQSKKDFLSKVYIAFKEITETEYWLELLFLSYYIDEITYKKAKTSCTEIKLIIGATIKTTKKNLNISV